MSVADSTNATIDDRPGPRDPAPGGDLAEHERRLMRLLRRPELASLVGALILYAFFAAVAGGQGFLSAEGTATWLNLAAELGILAMPIALLMIAGEFDLSVGSMVGAASMIVGVGSGHYGWPLWLSIVLALGVGVMVGLINGIVVVRTGLHSFIVTLAMLFALAGASLGLARAITGTTIISVEPTGSAKALFGSKAGQFQISILWFIGVTAVTTWVLTKSRFGNWVTATGGDLESARTSGVPTNRVKIILFIASACGAVLVGVLQTIEFSSGDVLRGQSFIFNSIVAAVIGGTLLTGGYGSGIGVFLGACSFAIVSQGIFYTGWNTDWTQLFIGGLLLMAVLANNYFRKLALSAR